MVPQGHPIYYTPGAPPPCQTQPLQLPQHQHVPYRQSAPPASFEPSPYAHSTHQVAYADTPVAVSSSCVQAVSAHHLHGNFVHFTGSQHTLSTESSMPCAWQGHTLTRCASPPPPAYPPGFEPKHDITSCATMTAVPASTTVPNAHLHPQPYAQPQAQQHPEPQPQPQSYNPCSQPASQSQPFHPHPHAHANAHPHQHSESHTAIDLQQQHQHQILQMQPPYVQSHQHQSSQMAYPAIQMACQTGMPHPAAQVSHSSIIQNYDGSGAVLGVPVMGIPVFLGANNLAPPDIQHHQQPVQKSHPEPSYPRHQSSKSIYHLTKYFQRSVSNCGSQPEEGRLQQCGWQPPARQANRAIFGRKNSRANMGRKFGSKPNFEKPDQKQLADTHQSHHLHQRDSFHKSSACEEKKPSHSQSTQIPNIMPASVKGFSDSYCEDIDKRSDQRSLELDSREVSSLALARSEAQLSFLVKSKQEGLSPETPGETATDCKLSYADNMTQQRKTMYPTPANMQQKAEERRNQEEMGELIYQKPRNYLRHFQGALSASYYRRENKKMDKQTELQEQCVGESEVAKSDSKGHMSNPGNDPDHCGNDFEMPMEIEDSGPIESPYQGQVSDFEKGIQEENFQPTSKSGEITEQNQEEKIRAPCFAFVFRRKRQEQRRGNSALVAQRQKRQLFQLLSRDLEKENSHILQCCRYIVKNEFLQGLHHINPTHELQDLHLMNLTHSRCAGAEIHSDVNSSHAEEMDTAETLVIASEPSDQSVVNHLVGNNQHLLNWEQVVVLEGADSCQNASKSPLATNGKQSCAEINVVLEAHCSAEVSAQGISCTNKEQELPEVSGFEGVDICENVRGSSTANSKQSCAMLNACQEAPCSAEVSGQEMDCSNKEQELIEDAQGPTKPADNILGQDAYCSAVVPSQALDWSSKSTEQIAEAPRSMRSREELMSGYMEEDRFAEEAITKSSSNGVDEVHPEPVMTSHNQSTVVGFVDNAESSLLVEPSLARYEKEAIFPWRHSDSYHLRNMEGHLAPAHYDCFKAPLITNGVDADTKELAMLSSKSNLDSQVSVSSLWDQPNSGLNVPGHNMDTSGLGTGYCDSFLGDEDDIFQYMNFDGFDTDSGMCFG